MKWRIVHKLTIASIFMILLTLLTGGVGLWQVLAVGQAMAQMREIDQQRTQALELLALGYDLVASMNYLLLMEETDFIRPEVMSALDALDRHLTSLQASLGTDQETGELLHEIQKAHDALSEAVNQVAFLTDEDQWDGMMAIIEDQMRPAQEGLSLHIRRLVQDANFRAEDVSYQSDLSARRAVVLLGGLLILTTGVATSWHQLVFRPISQSIALLRQGVARISGGDLDYELETHTGDEIEDLADQVNEMARSLQASQTRLEQWGHDLETSVAERTRELQEALEEQRRLSVAIQEMSTPVVPVHFGVIVMPLVGVIDAARAHQIVSGLLRGVESHNAQVAIVDVTGIPVMSSDVVSYLMQAAQAVRLLGAQVVLVGITPEVAKTIVELGIDLADGLVTRSDLQAGIEYALGTMGLYVTGNGA
jgi:anti-anti-sigma factor